MVNIIIVNEAEIGGCIVVTAREGGRFTLDASSHLKTLGSERELDGSENYRNPRHFGNARGEGRLTKCGASVEQRHSLVKGYGSRLVAKALVSMSFSHLST